MTNDREYDQGRALRGKPRATQPGVYYVPDPVLDKLSAEIIAAASGLMQVGPEPTRPPFSIAANQVVTARAPQLALDAIRKAVQVSDKVMLYPETRFAGLT